MEKEELIHKYFLDELSAEEHERFFELKEKDPDFREQLALEEDLRKAIISKERAGLKEELRSLEADLPPLNTKRKLLWTPLRIAASLLVLLGLGYFVFKPDAPDMKQLYSTYYEIYPNTVYAITRSDTTNSLERRSFVAYESGDYKTAIPLLEQLDKEGDKNYVDFYLGQLYLKTERPQKAITFFRRNVEKKQVFIAESHWYMALAYLNLGKSEKAKEVLKQLLITSDFKKEEAQALLEMLE